MYTSTKYDDLYRDINVRYMHSLLRRNPNLIEAAITLHQSGQIPPNTYLLDLDAHRKNARAIVSQAKKHRVSNYFMSKQIGRNPIICQAVINEGLNGVVAVDVQEAKSLYRYGIRIGHVGHLVQIPKYDIDYVLQMKPEVWTVYSVENARLISERAEKLGIKQNLLIQPVGKDDTMFDTMTGGILEDRVIDEVKKIQAYPNVRVVGTTSFPCMLYDLGTRKVRPIANFHTAVRVAKMLSSKLGLEISQVNVPGHSHASTMQTIAANGGTHGEPGTGVSGALPSQVFEDQPEIPAFVYVTEILHYLGEKVYVHGGGLAFPGGGYGVFPDGNLWVGGTDLEMIAFVGTTFERAAKTQLRVKYPGTDPFNYNLTLFSDGHNPRVGETALIGFSLPQIFTTRGWHAVVKGISENSPQLIGIFDQANNLVDEKGHLLGEKTVVNLLESI